MPVLSPSDCCTGCGACAAVCPRGAIRMLPDRLGFDAPRVDKSLCVECGSCSKACPVLAPLSRCPVPEQAWGLYAKEQALRDASSSGGVFGLLARQTLAMGGRVFGAAFDGGLNLEHREAGDETSLLPLLKSKYLQSRCWPVYSRIRQLLQQDVPVLFCGTGCQTAGLRRALGKLADSDKLLCVAVICHGVPSPQLWHSYRRWRERQQHAAMTNMDFRAEAGGICLRATFSNGSNVRYGGWSDPYIQLFLTYASLRPSCSRCTARLDGNGADLTLGDFWGAEKILPEFARKGLSLAFVQSEKGRRALESILPLTSWKTVPSEPALRENPSAVKPAPEPPEAEAFRRGWGAWPFPVLAAGRGFVPRMRAAAGWLLDGIRPAR